MATTDLEALTRRISKLEQDLKKLIDILSVTIHHRHDCCCADCVSEALPLSDFCRRHQDLGQPILNHCPDHQYCNSVCKHDVD